MREKQKELLEKLRELGVKQVSYMKWHDEPCLIFECGNKPMDCIMIRNTDLLSTAAKTNAVPWSL